MVFLHLLIECGGCFIGENFQKCFQGSCWYYFLTFPEIGSHIQWQWMYGHIQWKIRKDHWVSLRNVALCIVSFPTNDMLFKSCKKGPAKRMMFGWAEAVCKERQPTESYSTARPASTTFKHWWWVEAQQIIPQLKCNVKTNFSPKFQRCDQDHVAASAHNFANGCGRFGECPWQLLSGGWVILSRECHAKCLSGPVYYHYHLPQGVIVLDWRLYAEKEQLELKLFLMPPVIQAWDLSNH